MSKLSNLHLTSRILLGGVIILSFYNCYLAMMSMPQTFEALFWTVVTNVFLPLIVALLPAWIIAKLIGKRISKGFLDLIIFVLYLFLVVMSMGSTYLYFEQNGDHWINKILQISLIISFALILTPGSKSNIINKTEIIE